MDDTVLKEAIVRILKDDVFVDIIRDQVRAAVDSAVAAKDAEIESLKEELAETKAQLNGLEQYSRRLCLDVSGIPETPNEDTDRLVMDTAKPVVHDWAQPDTNWHGPVYLFIYLFIRTGTSTSSYLAHDGIQNQWLLRARRDRLLRIVVSPLLPLLSLPLIKHAYASYLRRPTLLGWYSIGKLTVCS